MFNEGNMRATDIGVGPSGDVWIISNKKDGDDGDYSIY
jgi:hypothetical protein